MYLGVVFTKKAFQPDVKQDHSADEERAAHHRRYEIWQVVPCYYHYQTGKLHEIGSQPELEPIKMVSVLRIERPNNPRTDRIGD
jgi:hypothetical protein